MMWVMSNVSLGRISSYLDEEEIIDQASHTARDKTVVQVKNGLFGWEGDQEKQTFYEESIKRDAKKLSKNKVSSEKDKKEEEEVKRTFNLENINLNVERGKLVIVIGATASGKSSLCSALLGEMVCKQGDLMVSGSVAWVPQTAWIRNCSLMDNIVFGKPFDMARYRKAIEVSEMKRDIEILPNGDQTEIGEKGINLSGGQKQRVSIARAV